MDALIPTVGFGEINFGIVQLGDRRRTRRLVQVADRMLQHPSGTLPDKLNHPAELKGLYRLVDQDRVTHAAVLSQHRELVRQRVQACFGDVLLLHDTTELDYTGKTTLADLGFIGKGHRQRGNSWPGRGVFSESANCQDAAQTAEIVLAARHLAAPEGLQLPCTG